MKFDSKVHYKIDRYGEHWLLGVRLTLLAVTFSFFYEEAIVL